MRSPSHDGRTCVCVSSRDSEGFKSEKLYLNGVAERSLYINIPVKEVVLDEVLCLLYDGTVSFIL